MRREFVLVLLLGSISGNAAAIAVNSHVSACNVPASLNEADGIAFDSATGNLVVTAIGEVTETTSVCSLVGTVLSDASTIFTAAEILPGGNLLVRTTEGTGRAREYTPAGIPAPGGIDFIFPADLFLGSLTFHAIRGTIFATGFQNLGTSFPSVLVEFSAAGTLLATYDTTTIDGAFLDSEGISYDPASGALLVADHDTGFLFEVAPEGTLVAKHDLWGLAGAASQSIGDLEGLAYDPATGRIFVGDNEGRIHTFVPEPATGLLLACGLVGLGIRRQRH